jgi:hypothetical protein
MKNRFKVEYKNQVNVMDAELICLIKKGGDPYGCFSLFDKDHNFLGSSDKSLEEIEKEISDILATNDEDKDDE